jgi:SpoVK/Ycf46/Vps4 family AAA+-type ATPase
LPSIDVDKLSGKVNEKKFCGADIEAVVSEATEKCYRDGLKSLTTDSLWSVVESTEGIGETQKEKIQKYEEKIKECHFRDASIVKLIN